MKKKQHILEVFRLSQFVWKYSETSYLVTLLTTPWLSSPINQYCYFSKIAFYITTSLNNKYRDTIIQHVLVRNEVAHNQVQSPPLVAKKCCLNINIVGLCSKYQFFWWKTLRIWVWLLLSNLLQVSEKFRRCWTFNTSEDKTSKIV